jgi:hypothetical protein
VFSKIDVRDIVRDHFATLVDYETGRRSFSDHVLFVVVPLVGSGVLLLLGIDLSETAVNVLITALSIFAGLLFNLLVLLDSLADRKQAPTGDSDARLMMKGIYANTAYAVLIALLTLVPLCLFTLTQNCTVRVVTSGLSYFLIGHFLLTLLMVLKRIHALLSHEFSRPRA